MTTVRALIIPVHGPPKWADVNPDLDSLQGIVGGYIETVGLGAEAHIYIDEEGKLKGKEVNRLATQMVEHHCPGFAGRDVIVGDAVALGMTDEGDEADAPPDVYTLAYALRIQDACSLSARVS
jgi:hypothetical protein